MPPGNVSEQAHDQTQVNTILAAVMTPIAIGVLAFFIYAIVVFRAGSDDGDGPHVKGNERAQRAWLVSTVVIVLALAIYGTTELIRTDQGIAGVGGGQGPTPIAAPPPDALDVQVIAQQWAFTYRFPQYGNLETTQLAIPVGRPVMFHVTSLDVVHSFWAYQLGVKVDAVNGASNVAGVTAEHTGTFDIRCSELCGLWHGEMFSKGQILSQSDFAAWIAQQKTGSAGARGLPPQQSTYYPDPVLRAG
jgi:cytochrome c oxidase subunit 2